MNDKEIEKLKEKIIDELVDKNVRTAYEFDGYEYDTDDWNFKSKIKDKFNDKLIEKTNEIFNNNEDIINKAIKDLIADLLPDVIYNYLSNNIHNSVDDVLQNQRNFAVSESINYMRNNLRF